MKIVNLQFEVGTSPHVHIWSWRHNLPKP